MSRILSELSEGGLLLVRARGKALELRLAEPDALSTLVSAEGLAFPRWREVMRFVDLAEELSALAPERPASALSAELSLGRPVGEGPQLVAWASGRALALARGSAPAVGGLKPL